MTLSQSDGGSFRFLGISYTLGEDRLSVAEMFPESKGLILKTGIPYVWETSQCALDLAKSAAAKLFGNPDLDKSKVGSVIYVTQSPSWQLPSHAYRIQEMLGLRSDVFAFDINQGCSGFVQAFILGVNLLASNRDVLIVTADTYRSKLDKTDRSTNAIFSDGAAAVLISSSRPTHRILASNHFADGSGADLLSQSIPGGSKPVLKMNGKEVYLFTRRVVLDQIKRVANASGTALEDIDLALVHQASKLVIDGISRDLEPFQIKVPTNLKSAGNTVSSTIPILMNQIASQSNTGKFVMSGFGVGLSCATLLADPISSE